jgi:hypothetical protein
MAGELGAELVECDVDLEQLGLQAELARSTGRRRP